MDVNENTKVTYQAWIHVEDAEQLFRLAKWLDEHMSSAYKIITKRDDEKCIYRVKCGNLSAL